MNTKYNDPKPMEHSKSSSKREVQSNLNLPQEIRKIKKQFNFTLNGTRKRTNKAQS